MSILGGYYFNNDGSDEGGVIYASKYSTITVSGGVFENNEAENGGAACVGKDAELLIRGGIFTGNSAGNGGGVFFVDGDGNINVRDRRDNSFRGDHASAFLACHNTPPTACLGLP